jgi:hypothetical protein
MILFELHLNVDTVDFNTAHARILNVAITALRLRKDMFVSVEIVSMGGPSPCSYRLSARNHLRIYCQDAALVAKVIEELESRRFGLPTMTFPASGAFSAEYMGFVFEHENIEAP